MTIYFISGLGADERVFSRLKLPPEWKIVYLGWPEFRKEDTVESYAKKYIPLIKTNEEFVLIGLSFGGMLVTELAKILKPKKTILISSIYSKEQLPASFRFIRNWRINRLFPAQIINIIPVSIRMQFGKLCLDTKSKEEKELVKDFIRKSSPRFLKWASGVILNWNNTIRPENIYHIIGDSDTVFPLKYINAHTVIPGGGHFMVFSRADEVTNAIVQIIEV
jgi:pimeloyl-ACP methyl ester carboxylesterase